MENFGLLLVLVLLQIHSAFLLPYSKSSGVINLTKANFAELVFGSEHVWVVEFYAPCGHCKQLAPEYEKLAKNLNGIVKIGAVNGDVEKELAGYFQIQGFPTIKIFPSQRQLSPDGKEKQTVQIDILFNAFNPNGAISHTLGFVKTPEDYQGPRTAAGIASVAVSRLPNFVTKITEKNTEFFSKNPDLAKVILFTNKKETTNLYKALSVDFHHSLDLGEIRENEKQLLSEYNVKSFPTLMVVTPEGERVVYDGELKHEKLFQFLKPFAKNVKTSETPTPPPPPPPTPVRPVAEEVTQEADFEDLCFNTNVNCFLTLLDPINTEVEDHRRYIQTLTNLQDKYSKFFRFLWIDGVKHQQFINEWNLASDLPSVVVFNQMKSSIIPFIGAFTEEKLGEFAEGIMQARKRAVKVDRIPQLTATTKDEL